MRLLPEFVPRFDGDGCRFAFRAVLDVSDVDRHIIVGAVCRVVHDEAAASGRERLERGGLARRGDGRKVHVFCEELVSVGDIERRLVCFVVVADLDRGDADASAEGEAGIRGFDIRLDGRSGLRLDVDGVCLEGVAAFKRDARFSDDVGFRQLERGRAEQRRLHGIGVDLLRTVVCRLHCDAILRLDGAAREVDALAVRAARKGERARGSETGRGALVHVKRGRAGEPRADGNVLAADVCAFHKRFCLLRVVKHADLAGERGQTSSCIDVFGFRVHGGVALDCDIARRVERPAGDGGRRRRSVSFAAVLRAVVRLDGRAFDARAHRRIGREAAARKCRVHFAIRQKDIREIRARVVAFDAVRILDLVADGQHADVQAASDAAGERVAEPEVGVLRVIGRDADGGCRDVAVFDARVRVGTDGRDLNARSEAGAGSRALPGVGRDLRLVLRVDVSRACALRGGADGHIFDVCRRLRVEISDADVRAQAGAAGGFRDHLVIVMRRANGFDGHRAFAVFFRLDGAFRELCRRLAAVLHDVDAEADTGGTCARHDANRVEVRAVLGRDVEIAVFKFRVVSRQRSGCLAREQRDVVNVRDAGNRARAGEREVRGGKLRVSVDADVVRYGAGACFPLHFGACFAADRERRRADADTGANAVSGERARVGGRIRIVVRRDMDVARAVIMGIICIAVSLDVLPRNRGLRLAADGIHGDVTAYRCADAATGDVERPVVDFIRRRRRDGDAFVRAVFALHVRRGRERAGLVRRIAVEECVVCNLVADGFCLAFAPGVQPGGFAADVCDDVVCDDIHADRRANGGADARAGSDTDEIVDGTAALRFDDSIALRGDLVMSAIILDDGLRLPPEDVHAERACNARIRAASTSETDI